MNKKKQIERHQLERFLSNNKLKVLVGAIVNSETPDFEVKINEQLISVEHSRLIKPNIIKIEQFKDKIIRLAHMRFEKKYSDKLYALFTFNNVILEGGQIAEQNHVEEIFRLIEEVYLNNKHLEFNVKSKGDKKKVSKIIKQFSVNNTQNFSHWQQFEAYSVDWIDIDWLKETIKKKEQNIKKYKKAYKENWLLLVSDFGTPASANRTDFIDFSDIKSKFDKIYIHSYRADEITIIK